MRVKRNTVVHMSDFDAQPTNSGNTGGQIGRDGTDDSRDPQATSRLSTVSPESAPVPTPAPTPDLAAQPESKPAGESGATSTVQVVTESPKRIDETLKDPLLRAPRRSSVILCIVFGAIFLLVAAATWLLFVRTPTGQQYDDLVWETLKDGFPTPLLPIIYFFAHSAYTITVIVVIGIVSVFLVVMRRRWLLLVQLTCFALASFLAGFILKRTLPRPTLDPSLANPTNSSPSGHSVAAFAAAAVLVMAVPLSARAIASVVSFLFASSVGLSVVVEKWHRPSDVIVAFLMVTGLALLTMAFTRASGMDKAGARRSSASIQIVSTVMLVAGVCSLLFSGYLVWQVIPGLGMEAAWALPAAQGSASLAILGTAALGFGLITALRQITASPLSAVGLLGAPPAPPTASEPSTRHR